MWVAICLSEHGSSLNCETISMLYTEYIYILSKKCVCVCVCGGGGGGGGGGMQSEVQLVTCYQRYAVHVQPIIIM